MLTKLYEREFGPLKPHKEPVRAEDPAPKPQKEKSSLPPPTESDDWDLSEKSIKELGGKKGGYNMKVALDLDMDLESDSKAKVDKFFKEKEGAYNNILDSIPTIPEATAGGNALLPSDNGDDDDMDGLHKKSDIFDTSVDKNKADGLGAAHKKQAADDLLPDLGFGKGAEVGASGDDEEAEQEQIAQEI